MKRSGSKQYILYDFSNLHRVNRSATQSNRSNLSYNNVLKYRSIQTILESRKMSVRRAMSFWSKSVGEISMHLRNATSHFLHPKNKSVLGSKLDHDVR